MSAVNAVKHDEGKLPWDLMPFDALEEVVKVLRFGAAKYAPRNWEAGLPWSRIFSSAMRHLVQWFKGDDVDRESGLHPLAHAACCVLFLLAYVLRKSGNDDRPAARQEIVRIKVGGR